MGKLTEKKQQEMLAQVAELIPLIDDIMGRNQDVKSWEDLSERDLELLNSTVLGFDDIRLNVIEKEDSAKVRAFLVWNESLGGYDT